MFVRLSFLLLVALNLGAAAWLLFGHAPPLPLPPATDPGVPELLLLSEIRPARPAGAAAATSGSAAPSSPPDACTTLGPFMSASDMRAAIATLSGHVARVRYHEEPLRRSHGFQVYLPAAANREAALEEARLLAAKGVHDYYVVTAGDSQNTISLGLFDDRSNAQQRLAQVQKLGFAAKVDQRVDAEPAYWVDFAVPTGSGFNWQTWLPGRANLQARPVDCPHPSGRSSAAVPAGM